MFWLIKAETIKDFSLKELYNIIMKKIPIIIKGQNENTLELKSLCRLNGVEVYEA